MLNPVMKEIVDIKERLNRIEERLSVFAEMLHQDNRADIDYISMETGIDLDQNDQE